MYAKSLTLALLCSLLQGLKPNPSRDHQDQTNRAKYIISFAMSSKEVEAETARIRSRIWFKFRRHQAGSIEVDWFSKEGELSRYRFRIGQSDQARWQINVGVEQHLRERGGPQMRRQYVVRDNYTASSLLVLDMSGQKVSSEPVAPGLDFFKAHKIQLVDNTGKVLQEI